MATARGNLIVRDHHVEVSCVGNGRVVTSSNPRPQSRWEVSRTPRREVPRPPGLHGQVVGATRQSASAHSRHLAVTRECRPSSRNRWSAATARHPLRRCREIHVRELAGRGLLTPRSGYPPRSLIERACACAPVAPTIAMESASPVALHALARALLGVLFVASDAVPPTTRPQPVIVDDDGPLVQPVSAFTPRATGRAVADFAALALRLASPGA